MHLCVCEAVFVKEFCKRVCVCVLKCLVDMLCVCHPATPQL